MASDCESCGKPTVRFFMDPRYCDDHLPEHSRFCNKREHKEPEAEVADLRRQLEVEVERKEVCRKETETLRDQLSLLHHQLEQVTQERDALAEAGAAHENVVHVDQDEWESKMTSHEPCYRAYADLRTLASDLRYALDDEHGHYYASAEQWEKRQDGCPECALLARANEILPPRGEMPK